VVLAATFSIFGVSFFGARVFLAADMRKSSKIRKNAVYEITSSSLEVAKRVATS
jgi:hypothetical protein